MALITMQYVDGRDHRYHGVHDELPVVQYSIPARRTLVLYPCASPVDHATLVKVLTCPRYDKTSPVVIDNIETIAARGGSLFMLKFFRALVAVIPTIGSLHDVALVMPTKISSAGNFIHIHIAKLIYQILSGYP